MKHLSLFVPALLALAVGTAAADDKTSSKPAQGQPAAASSKPAQGQPAAANPKGSGGGESQMEILRQKLKTDKRYIVSENMDLTADEAKSFWPLYDAYQKDLDKLNQRLGSIAGTYIEAYNKGPISDDLSTKLVKDSLALEKDELDAKEKHLGKLKKVLPPYKVVRYAQIENKIRALVKYELAVGIPLAD
jgi:hypothetical protein